MSVWMEALKTGTFKAKNGKDVNFSTDDLDAIVSHYDPSKREAALVFGHPEDTHPSYGWVEKFRRTGEVLEALVKDIPEAVKTLIRKKRYKKRSLSLEADGVTVRHLGLLGAVPPAVDGLADIELSEGAKALVIELSIESLEQEEPTMTPEEIKALQDENEALKKDKEALKTDNKKLQTDLSASAEEKAKTEVATKVDKLVEEKRILPAQKDAVSAIALSLGKSEDAIELSSGAGAKTVQQHFWDFLEAQSKADPTISLSAPEQGTKTEGAIISADYMTRV